MLVRDNQIGIFEPRIDEATTRNAYYPVEMCRSILNPTHPMFLYKFPDANGKWKCYKFIFQHRIVSMNLFATTCIGCRRSISRIYRWTDSTEGLKLKTIRTDGRQLLSNPLSQHLPCCVPLNYAEEVFKCPPVSEEIKEGIIAGNSPLAPSDLADDDVVIISDDLNVPMVGGTQSVYQHPASGVLPVKPVERNVPIGKEPESISSAATLASVNMKTEQNDLDVVFVSKQSTDAPQAEPVMDVAERNVLVSNDRRRKLPSSSNGELMAVVKCEYNGSSTPVPIPHPILPPVPAKRTPLESVRLVPLETPKTFKKVFDAYIFNEDEVEISVVDGSLLRVCFEKKLVSPTDTHSSLLHQLPLPAYVDIESLTSCWENGTIVVSARSKSSRHTS